MPARYVPPTSSARAATVTAAAVITATALALGCGLHLHRPRDAANAEGADGELKASRLVDGFAEELAQSQAMLAEEVAAAQAWAEVGRNRDLLDILGARGEAEVEELYFKRCRARFRGDGWTTLCSKISARLYDLTGHAFPLSEPAPAAAGGKAKAPVVAPDPGADLLRELRTLQRHWKGPDSGESQLGRAVNEHQLAARALRLTAADARAPGCPLFDPPGRAPVLQASVDRQRGLCRDRRANLQAMADRLVCRGPACGPSQIGGVVAEAIAVHDALQRHHDELARRLRAYEAAKRPCSGPEPPKGKPVLTPAPQPTRPEPGRPDLSSEPGTPARPEPPTSPPAERPASVAARPASHGPSAMSLGPGSRGHGLAGMSDRARSQGHVATDMLDHEGPKSHAPSHLPLSAGFSEHVAFAMSPGAGLIGLPWALLAAPAGPADAPAPTPGAPSLAPGGAPTPATRATTATPGTAGATSTPGLTGTTAPATTSAGATTTPATRAPGSTTTPADPASPGTPTTSTGSPGAPALTPGSTSPAPATPVFTPGDETCDDAVLQARFAALAEVPIPDVLVSLDLAPLAELGRRLQLAEQLAAVDALIDARQIRARRRAAADDDPKAAQALAVAPRFARVLHTTIVGIDRLQKTVDTLELAVLALIRETLRVEHDALAEAIAHAERRLRLTRAKLAAQLDEAALLMEAHASLAKLERAGCTALPLMPAYEAGKCRDELTKSLVAFGNAWTLGRAGQKRADALDLGVRHDASIGRSRAAMALRQVYLAAGVTELVGFTKGGMSPEALAQLIVSTVGFGVLAGAVLAP